MEGKNNTTTAFRVLATIRDWCEQAQSDINSSAAKNILTAGHGIHK
jgi:hypothetical protein